MQIQAVKGMRDFYPPDMRLRNWIMDAWRRVSLRNGFEEYDSPIMEYLELFTIKSGQEIVDQLFSLTDRGDRRLAIKPEITPSLGRMVNAKINSLPRPVKWFSMPRLCRAENPQKGRLREFFQWNIDVIGSDETLADAECVFVLADLLREVGLSASDVVIRIGSRALTTLAMKSCGVGDDRLDSVLPVLDKRPKIAPEEFDRLSREAGLTSEQVTFISRYQDAPELSAVRAMLPGPEAQAEIDRLDQLLGTVKTMGAGDYCRLDLRIVRGLAYYTGIVYEAFDCGASMRALAGGGRYDRLLELLGGPQVGATGFGMGDVVLGILLDEKGKIPPAVLAGSIDCFVIDGEGAGVGAVLTMAGALRTKGVSAEFSYKRQATGKQLNAANKRSARYAIILSAGDTIALKCLQTGRQSDIDKADLLADPGKHLI